MVICSITKEKNDTKFKYKHNIILLKSFNFLLRIYKNKIYLYIFYIILTD